MKTVEIQLTQGKCALIDLADLDIVSPFKWCASYSKATNSFYAYSGGANGSGRVLMHRLILGRPSGLVVDHVNHDTLDNRRENIRACVRSKNQQNMSMHKDNSSGFKGVSSFGSTGKWRARIHVNGKEVGLGVFDNIIDAAAAYDSAARLYFGEFAKTNKGGGR